MTENSLPVWFKIQHSLPTLTFKVGMSTFPHITKTKQHSIYEVLGQCLSQRIQIMVPFNTHTDRHSNKYRHYMCPLIYLFPSPATWEGPEALTLHSSNEQTWCSHLWSTPKHHSLSERDQGSLEKWLLPRLRKKQYEIRTSWHARKLRKCSKKNGGMLRPRSQPEQDPVAKVGTMNSERNNDCTRLYLKELKKSMSLYWERIALPYTRIPLINVDERRKQKITTKRTMQ